MGIFDYFKTKSGASAAVDLEDLLKKAASEAAFRPELYKRLLTSDLIVLTQNSNIREGRTVLKKNLR